MDVRVHDNPESAALEAGGRVAGLASEATQRFSIGLAGGSTPAQLYRELLTHQIDWANVDLWLSDERWVPHDDPRSNAKMALETLADDVDADFYRPDWDPGMSPAYSASRYESILRQIHQTRRPDLVLLGLGADGHTASLYPGSRALEESDRWYVANTIPETGEDRLTATYPLLWTARHLVVLAFGQEKAAAARDSLNGSTPAGRIGDGDSEVEWFLDRDAASLIS